MEKKKLLVLLPVILGIAIGFGYTYYSTGIGAGITWVSGTEYQGGEPGSAIIRVTDVFGRPITVNGCNITIYYPDGSVWIDNQAMTARNPPGTYVYQFTTPFDKVGNYHEYVACEVQLPGGRTVTIYNDKSFHVSQALSLINDTASAQIRIIS